MSKQNQNTWQTPIQIMNTFKILFFFSFMFVSLSNINAQIQRRDTLPQPKLNLKDYNKGVKMEFVSYPMFALSSFALGMGNRFDEVDSQKSHRPLIYKVIGITGIVTSSGTWGIGISLQGKPTWKDLAKVGGIGLISWIGYEGGKQTADIFKHR